MKHWWGLYSKETWQELLVNGGKEDGFSPKREAVVDKMEHGDILICYCSGIKTWFNAYRIISNRYHYSGKKIFKGHDTPFQIQIEVLFPSIKPVDGIRTVDTINTLDIFAKIKNPKYWGVCMQTFPTKLSDADGKYLLDGLKKIDNNLR